MLTEVMQFSICSSTRNSIFATNSIANTANQYNSPDHRLGSAGSIESPAGENNRWSSSAGEHPTALFLRQLRIAESNQYALNSSAANRFGLCHFEHYSLSAFQKRVHVFQSPEIFEFHNRLHPPMMNPVHSVFQTHFSLDYTTTIAIRLQ